MEELATDEEIARRVQKEDNEAFGALVERYEARPMHYDRRAASLNPIEALRYE